MSVARPRTLFEKVWDGHVVRPATADTPASIPKRPALHYETDAPPS